MEPQTRPRSGPRQLLSQQKVNERIDFALVGTATKVRQEENGPLTPLEANLSWLLATVNHALATEMTAAFEAVGISPRGHCVLSRAQSGGRTQSELAEEVGLDKTTMVVTVDELEQAGLAERHPSETDRRARVITVTDAGRRKIAEGEEIVDRIQQDVLESLPVKKRAALMDALAQLVSDRLSETTPCQRPVRRRAVRT